MLMKELAKSVLLIQTSNLPRRIYKYRSGCPSNSHNNMQQRNHSILLCDTFRKQNTLMLTVPPFSVCSRTRTLSVSTNRVP